MDLACGHIYGLLGKNGEGKSTLLKCMAGLVFTQQGEYLLDGVLILRHLPSTLERLFDLTAIPFLDMSYADAIGKGGYREINAVDSIQPLLIALPVLFTVLLWASSYFCLKEKQG
ncbi:MAG: ATP-binding cassette domain-containing protein [Sphingobacteriaceae bacterium]